MHQLRTPCSARSHLMAGRSCLAGISPARNTPGVRSPPSYSAVYTYGTRPAMRGTIACRTAEMCQPTSASTSPDATSAPTSSATRCGGPEPSTTERLSSRVRTPPFEFTSSAASCPQSSQDGPKIPADPCSGITSATSSVGSSRRNSPPSLTRDSAHRNENLTDLVLWHRSAMDEGIDRGSAPAAAVQRLAQLLSQAEHGVTRQIARVLEEEDSTVEQWRALVLLADGISHSMSEVAEFALLPAPTLTRLVDRMVADNLAYRTADPEDRRRVLVHITPRGTTLQKRLAKRIESSQAAILAEADPEDVAQLAALLTDLAARLR